MCAWRRDSSAPVWWCRNVLGPKCPGSEVSWHLISRCDVSSFALKLEVQYPQWKVFRIGTVRYHWPMSAHASQAFSIASCTDSEDLPPRCPSVCRLDWMAHWKIYNYCIWPVKSLSGTLNLAQSITSAATLSKVSNDLSRNKAFFITLLSLVQLIWFSGVFFTAANWLHHSALAAECQNYVGGVQKRCPAWLAASWLNLLIIS